MSSIKQRENLFIAEKKASNLFLQIEKRGLIKEDFFAARFADY